MVRWGGACMPLWGVAKTGWGSRGGPLVLPGKPRPAAAALYSHQRAVSANSRTFRCFRPLLPAK